MYIYIHTIIYIPFCTIKFPIYSYDIPIISHNPSGLVESQLIIMDGPFHYFAMSICVFFFIVYIYIYLHSNTIKTIRKVGSY